MKNIGSGLNDILPLIKKREDILETVILHVYRDLMGKNASRLRAENFKGGVLSIAPINSGWKREGKLQCDSIRKQVNARLGFPAIERIAWINWTKRESIPVKDQKELQPESNPFLNKAVEDISDERARNAFIKLGRNLGIK